MRILKVFFILCMHICRDIAKGDGIKLNALKVNTANGNFSPLTHQKIFISGAFHTESFTNSLKLIQRAQTLPDYHSEQQQLYCLNTI